MTNPYEYQSRQQSGAQWQWYQPQFQPYPYVYGQQFYGQPPPAQQSSRPSAVTAILAAVLGLVLTGVSGYLEVHALITLRRGLFELPVLSIVILSGYGASLLLLLAGSLCVFLRKTAGGITLIIGTALTLASWLTNAAWAGLFDYFEMLFEYFGVNSVLLLITPILSLITLIPAVLPATFRYLRHQPRAHFQGNPATYPAPQPYPFR